VKKRLAILIYSLASGGAERQVSILLQELAADFDITLVLMNDTIFYDIPKDTKIIYLERSLPNESGIKKLLKLPLLGYKYKKILHKERIDISLSLIKLVKLFKKIERLKKEDLSLPKKRFTFVSIGRLDSGKNHTLLIEALQKIDADLWIIGDGELKESLELKIKNLGLEGRVQLLGRQENPYKFLNRADCFVFGSNHEGFPNVLLEALACGVPVISTDCQSGPREILAPESDMTFQLLNKIDIAEYGVLIPIGRVDRMREAMLLMIKDNDLRKSYQKRALQWAGDFNIDVMLKQYKEVLQ